MKSEWDKGMKLTWGDIISLEYGKPVPDKFQTNGDVPVFGTNGQIGTSNLPPLCSHASTIVGRKGAYRGVHYSNVPFSVIDTAFFVEETTKLTDSKWIYYKLLSLDINRMDSGSAIPSTDRSEIYSLPVTVPPLPTQRKIASILSALDDKIEINNAICRNLEKLLLTVYRNVKCASECVVKELNSLAEFSNRKRLISRLNYQTYFSTENMLPGKEGAIAAASLPTTPKVTACNPGDILVSNIRPYFKKIVYCSNKCGCSSDVLCFHPKEDIYSTWLFCSLYEDDFFDYVTAGSKGTKMPRGDKAHIMRYGIDVPPRKKLEEFKSMGNLVLTQINNLRSGNKHLSQLRDSILPKLMNGELDVDNVKLK